MEPSVQYVASEDGVRIAFAVVGTGKPVVVVPEPGISLIEATRIPEWGIWVEKLGESYQVVLIDGRGFGSSELNAIVTSPDQMVEDVRAVASALSLTESVILARGLNCRTALKVAAEHRALVSHLVLVAPDLGSPHLVQEDAASEDGVAIQSVWGEWSEVRVEGTRHLSHSSWKSRRTFGEISRGGSAQKLVAIQAAYASVDGYALARGVVTPTLVLLDEADTPTARNVAVRSSAEIHVATRSEIHLGSWLLCEDNEGEIIRRLDAFLANAG